ncbi:MAG: tatA [Alphaproteobacteria bacterium]|jgi:sec-independent protein translocase protein TatA|nr:tatA [Alphaproteobacteria bacterium]
MGMSIGHMALLFGIVLVLFGAGKLPRVMGDIAKGVRAFKEGMKDGEEGNSNDNVAKPMTDKDHAA